MMRNEIRIGIIEDHPMIQRCLINDVNSMENCSLDFVGDTFDSLKKALRISNPHIILLDIILKGEKVDGKDIAVYLRNKHPEIKVIIISDYYDDYLISALKSRGVKAYLPKSMAEGKILESVISKVYEKNDFISIQVESEEKVDKFFINGIKLSDSKQRILKYLGNGFKQIEISEIMGLNEKTVHKHLHELRDKLEVKTNTELMQKAGRLGFL